MIKGLMAPKSLDSILSSFTKTMNDLQKYADMHDSHVKDKQTRAEKLHEEIIGHEDERSSARRIHTNLTNLLMKG